MKLLTPSHRTIASAAPLLLLAPLAACAGRAAPAAPGDHGHHPPRAGQPRAVLTERPTASSVVGVSARPAATVVDRSEIGRTAQDKPIYVYRISGGGGEGGGTGPDARPGLLVVAGLDARHGTGPTIARALVDHLEGNRALDHATVYVVAHANPDAAGRKDPAEQTPGGTLSGEDADRDGRVDEDGPQDLNGDGHVTMMRTTEPRPEYGVELTHVVDPDHPRLMRPADRAKGEVATHALLPEASDQDGDGKMGEDGAGGVDLNKNFPFRWPESGNNNGAYPLSEPESKALATWLLDRPNIVATIVYGPHDTIINVPNAGGYDHTGRVPTGLERGDKELMDRLSESYKEATKLSQADKVGMDGSFAGWAYAHLGLVTIATNPWQRPEPPKEEGEEEGKDEGKEGEGAAVDQPAEPAAEQPEPQEPPFVMIGDFKLVLTQSAIQDAMVQVQSMSEAEQAERMEAFQALPLETQQRIMSIAQGAADQAADQPADQAAPGGQRPARQARKGGGGGGKDSDEAKWLAYADRVGGGFVDWHPHDHPQLGRVEIGGFVPGFMMNAPEDQTDAIVEAQGAFIELLLGMMPRVTIDDPVVEQAGDGVWRVSVTVRNEGELPTRTALGAKARRLTPFVVALDVPQERLLAGSTINRTDSLAPGETMRAEWLVLAEDGSTLNAQLRTEEFGVTDIEIELAQTGQRGGPR